VSRWWAIADVRFRGSFYATLDHLVKTESYKENLLDALRNPEAAADYLTACLEDSDVHVFLLALRDVAEAQSRARN
jgi:DNA-binding phage protein